MQEGSQLPMRDKNLGGEEEATSAENNGGDVVTEIEEDGDSTAKASKFNLIRSLVLCMFVCLYDALFPSLFLE